MENRCVCCGEIIPEGTQYCRACDYISKSKDDTYDDITFEDAVSYRIPLPVIAEEWHAFFHEHIFCCPRCKDNFNGNEYEMDYCWSCGQALDWSEEAKEKAIKEYEERKKND